MISQESLQTLRLCGELPRYRPSMIYSILLCELKLQRERLTTRLLMVRRSRYRWCKGQGRGLRLHMALPGPPPMHIISLHG